ncbi:MAG: pilus assembly protein PilP [Pseudomonadota bacterium]
MKNNFLKFPFLVCLICLIPLFGSGCNNKGDSPQQDLVVKKVIPKANKIPSSKIALPDNKKPADDKIDKKPGEGEISDAEAGENAIAVERYNPVGRIDPFIPLFKEEQVTSATETDTKKKRRAHLTPLEKVDLSQLKLLGVILAPSGNRAMVSEMNGKGYVVTVGTYMGISSGRVVEIISDRIIVEEEVENILGKISLRKRELKLQKPAGE